MRKIDPFRLTIGIVLFSLLTTIFASSALAEVETEIEHLLCYIETSDCTFNRNGTLYTGEKAVEHIRKKYSYAKRWIKTTEDFIKHAATKSSMSGNPYRVSCEGVEMPTAQWLQVELLRFRDDNLVSPKPDCKELSDE